MFKDKQEKSIPEGEWCVDPTKCNGCGDCHVICPVSLFTISPPPCQTACPINTEAQTYVSLIQQGKFAEALASIRDLHPFAGTLGRVCTHPCEKECTRGEIEGSVAIRALKRCAAEYGQGPQKAQPNRLEATGEKVAIVGSGPAGLMAAYDLARLDHKVTVFELLPVAGGMLYVGIPEYRLPREIIKAEIDQIENLGVDIRLNIAIGKDMTIDALFEEGFRAILLATGAHQSLKMQIPGEDNLEGFLDAISFLREVNLGHKTKVTGKAVIVGGGNAAIDAARTLLRLGSKAVNIIYRRSVQDMSAIESEVKEAEREGVKIHYLVAPTKPLAEGGRVVGLECIHTELSEPDESGQRRPMPIAGSEFFIEADLVISAIGQEPDISFLPGNDSISISKEGLIMVDKDTMSTNQSGIFAAGDNVSGPATVINALAAGKRAAVSIDRYLRGEDVKKGCEEKAGATFKVEKQIWWCELPRSERKKMPELSIKERSLNFDEIEPSLTQPLAVEEASRCLKCAMFAYMDLESCCGESCRICEHHCQKRAIRTHYRGLSNGRRYY